MQYWCRSYSRLALFGVACHPLRFVFPISRAHNRVYGANEPVIDEARCPMGNLHFLGRLFLALSESFLNSSITSFRCLGSPEELTACLGSASEVTARLLTPL